jgi:hypothetical protein
MQSTLKGIESRVIARLGRYVDTSSHVEPGAHFDDSTGKKPSPEPSQMTP